MCRAIRFWGASSANARRRDRLLPSSGDRLLPGGIDQLLPAEIGIVFWSTTSSSFWWTFAGLHCEHLPVSTEVHYLTEVHYFNQHTMSTSVNGAADAFGTGPFSGYNLNRLFMSIIFSMSAVVLAIFIFNLSSDKIAHVHIYTTTVLCVIFYIKSNIKMSNFLTTSVNVIVVGLTSRYMYSYFLQGYYKHFLIVVVLV